MPTASASTTTTMKGTRPSTSRRLGGTVREVEADGGRTGRVVAIYLIVQAAVGVALWVAWTWSPTVRSWFELAADRPGVMDAFAVADLGAAVSGSVVSAWGFWRGAAWSVPAAAFTAGTLLYPTLFLVGWVSLEGTGALCLAIMIAPSVLTSWIAWQSWRRQHRSLADR